MIITIDGPVATGKSTLAKKLAEALNFAYFDTGAMYRAFTWFVLDEKIDYSDVKQVKKLLDRFTYHIEQKEGIKHYFVHDKDVTTFIRHQSVNLEVSSISAISIVRQQLVKLQQKFGAEQNAVFEGRDMGTEVFPEAFLKFFLQANSKERAQRRFDEFKAFDPQQLQNLTVEKLEQQIFERDLYDSTRSISPLKPADHAIIIDTSGKTIEQVLELMLLSVRQSGFQNFE